MKTNKIKLFATLVLIFGMTTAYTQSRRDRDHDSDDRPRHDQPYENNRRNDRRNEYERDDRRNEYDRDDHDRVRDYEGGGNNYRRNPYDYRNLPNDWERRSSARFDWYRFDWDNRYDPRFGNRDYYDIYFPWDPRNEYDIRNRRDFYGNNQYWSGGCRPNRVIIVPPIIRRGHPSWAYKNHRKNGRHGHGRRW
jgi:hypothetical protein